MAASTSRVRRAYRGINWLRNSRVVPSAWRTRPPRHAQLPHPVAGRQGAVDGAVAMACPPGRALVAPRSQRRRELGLEHRLDRLAHLLAQLLFKVLPKCNTAGWVVSFVLLSCMVCLPRRLRGDLL